MGRRFFLNLPMFTLLAPANSMKQSIPSISTSLKPKLASLSTKPTIAAFGEKYLVISNTIDSKSEKKIRAISL